MVLGVKIFDGIFAFRRICMFLLLNDCSVSFPSLDFFVIESASCKADRSCTWNGS